jgi:Tol biopolymer transport system component/predicted Ser/Thr protein kinase
MPPASPGSRIDHYEIVEQIGQGGMGEVYRARDTRLPRQVAIKRSRERFSDRFTQEAQIIAALNHPNISTLLDVGQDYLVMEMVEGPTLADRLADGPLSLDEASGIARQVADALEYAHERGVIHRDLKPGNIKIRPDGVVKVLDFGLAKAVGSASSDQSPTISARQTDPGMILGTAPYMSPEQAKGKPVDKRTDIWAFGCVFYEMLTGMPPHQRDSTQDTLASILRDEPDLSKVPAQARRLLRRCLEKDPHKRLRHVGDVMALLDEPPSDERPAAATLPAASRAGGRKWLWLTAGLLAAMLMVVAAFFGARSRETAGAEPDAPTMFDVVSTDSMRFISGGAMALSRDGQWMVFPASGKDGITRFWIRERKNSAARVLAGTEVGPQSPPAAFSYDGKSVLFAQNGVLKRIPRDGGPPTNVAELKSGQNGVTTNAEGVIVLGLSPGARSPLYRVPITGGTPEPVTALTKDETRHAFPQFLPDGHHFLYIRVSADPNVLGVYVGSIDVKPEAQSRTRVLATNRQAYYAASKDGSGDLLFMRDGVLMAQPFDAKTFQVQGDAARVADNVDSFAAANYGLFFVSENGTLVYRTALPSSATLTWLNQDGLDLGTFGEAGDYSSPAVSPDGTRVAVAVGPPGQRDIYVMDLKLHNRTRLTLDGANNGTPVWSPDNTYIAFSSTRGGSTQHIYIKPADGSQNERRLIEQAGIPMDWTRPDVLLFGAQPFGTPGSAATGSDIWALPDPAGANGPGKPVPILTTVYNESQAQLSHDGRWMAYMSNRSGQPEIYVQPFSLTGDPSGGGPVRSISNGSTGAQPHWRLDDKQLFYSTLNLSFMAVDVLDTSHGFQYATPKRLFATPPPFINVWWSLSQKPLRFLFAAAPQGTEVAPFTVVVNWKAELKQ